MGAFAELLGPSLVGTAENSKIRRFDTRKTDEALADKHVGLLFAADWSEESRAFASELNETCTAVAAAGGAFQLVLVSSDRNVEDFAKMLASLPGALAVPFTDSLKARETALTKQFQVKALPSLIMLAPDGRLVNRAARTRVSEPAAFPWPPPTLAEALGPSFENEHGERVSLSSILGPRKYIALYFGATSCSRCRAFSRRLAEAYAAVMRGELGSEGELEVIYVSADRSAEEAAAARRASPWLQLPYAERWRRDALHDILDVGTSPALVLLDSALRVCNPDARNAVDRLAPFPWLPRLVWDADARADWERSPAEAPVLMVLAERAGASWDSLEAAMLAVAKEAAQQPPLAAPGGQRPSARPVFMLARERQGLGMAVRRLAKLGEAGPRPQAVLLDMSAGGTYYVLDAAKELNAANLRAFMAAYAAGTLLPQASGPVQTITVTAALTHVPAGGADEEEVNPWEVALNCILCPITCPLMCAFKCCLGCCMLTALGAAVGTSGMGGMASGRHSSPYD